MLINKKIETKVIWILFVLLIFIGLNGCAKTKGLETSQPDPQVEKKLDVPTIMKMEGIANVLGCMFAPGSCEKKVDPVD